MKRLTLLLLAALSVLPYTMTHDRGFIAVRDNAAGGWAYRSEVPLETLSPQDRFLLELGLGLENRADFTRAVEDFCS